MSDFNDYLSHYGVKDMRWGVIRDKIRANRDNKKEKKLAKYKERLNTKLSKSMFKAGFKPYGDKDVELLDYRSGSLAKRMAKMASKQVQTQVVTDLVTGKLATYKQRDALAKKATNVAIGTVVSTVIKDQLAASVLRRYDNDGKPVWEPKGRVTPEQVAETSIRVAKGGLFVATWLGNNGFIAPVATGAIGRYSMDVLNKINL